MKLSCSSVVVVGGAKIRNSEFGIRKRSAFTLIELLVVIVILGILAALTIPALKNLGKSNIQLSASRQLLDDVGRARQLAISHHTTVYMVFLPTNYWGNLDRSQLTAKQLTIVTNLVEKQLTGYAFVSYGQVGDQPGQHQWHYLSDWQALPDNNFIASWKFANPSQTFNPNNRGSPFTFTVGSKSFSIYQFDYRNDIPFPNADTNAIALAGTSYSPYLPYIAFNYLGQLVSSANDLDSEGNGADIPLAQGTVNYGYDGATRSPMLSAVTPSDITESPPGSSTNTDYNIVHIDPLTGRATLEFYQMP